MSVAGKSLTFLAITFAISWGLTLGGEFLGFKDALGAFAILVGMMTGPAIAALICAMMFEEGRLSEVLGLRFKPNLWWLFAWLIPIALAVIAVAASILFSSADYMDMGEAVRGAAAAQGHDPSEIPLVLKSTPFIIATSLFAGFFINGPLLTITEELGWRGYLHHLWRPHGFWRASLGTGVIWGIWHAPAIVFYGLNYPENAQLGVGLFVIWCMLLSPIMTLIRDRGGSTWAAGIAHGTINSVGGLTLLALNPPDFPWNGLVGIGGFIALALGVAIVFVMQRKAPT